MCLSERLLIAYCSGVMPISTPTTTTLPNDTVSTTVGTLNTWDFLGFGIGGVCLACLFKREMGMKSL